MKILSKTVEQYFLIFFYNNFYKILFSRLSLSFQTNQTIKMFHLKKVITCKNVYIASNYYFYNFYFR